LYRFTKEGDSVVRMTLVFFLSMSWLQKEIDLMIKQEDVVYFFNELDRIVEATDTENSQPAW